MLGIGSENFRLFLAGGHQMDRHFEETPAEQNAPMLMALLGFGMVGTLVRPPMLFCLMTRARAVASVSSARRNGIEWEVYR